MNQKTIEFKRETLDFEFLESINMLRGSIQMAGYHYKVISLTSALPNEGKSFIAFQLAQSMAAIGKKTVFVDCDIRNSKIKAKYDIQQSTTGLSEYLCGLVSESDVVYPTITENLYIVFAGRSAPNPSELLSGDIFGTLIDNLKASFDYIILDTPPVNIVVDSLMISVKADTTILVVKSCITEKKAAIHAKTVLNNSGVKILGTVLNLFDAKKNGYGSYGYGKYGYGKYGYGNNTKNTKNI